MRILLVDDHTLFREALLHVLRQFDGAAVVIEAATAREAIRLAAHYRDVVQHRGFAARDGTPAAIAGRVIDIPTGQAKPLKEHDDWLRYQVATEIVRRPNAWIDIFGYASKKGSVQKNLELSEARTLAVKAVLDSELRKLGRSLEGMVKIDHGFGENAPGYNAAESDNDARWRAVDVMVYGSRPADIKSPPLPQPPR